MPVDVYEENWAEFSEAQVKVKRIDGSSGNEVEITTDPTEFFGTTTHLALGEEDWSRVSCDPS